MRASSFGAPMARYFAMVDPAEADLDPRFRWEVRAYSAAGYPQNPFPAK